MNFDDAQVVDSLYWQMRQSDFPRARNRALIDSLFNGAQPYTAKEEQEQRITVNVNFLESTRLAHDARSQFYNAFLKPANYFTCKTDFPPVHKRQKISSIVTKEINRQMRKSLLYFEAFRSKFALDILHGIGPSVYRDHDRWTPEPIGVEDVLVPARTRLTLENLPFFILHRSYTGPELIKLTKGKKRDPAWNMPLVDACLRWIDERTMQLVGNNYPDIWSPEKVEERIKSDGGYYAGDDAPTIEVIDFYFWSDEGKNAGWRRRMLIDTWATPEASIQISSKMELTRKKGEFHESAFKDFLYNPGKRKYASDIREIINFQFADLSAVAPFRYHSVRSLGFLLYELCHLQNRLRCKFTQAVFESLMMYFRVRDMEEAERVLKVELADKGFIDDTLKFVTKDERHVYNEALAQMGLRENASLIMQHSQGYTQPMQAPFDRREKTAFQVMTESNSTSSLVSAALTQAYRYQEMNEYPEVFRRFCKRRSSDPAVIEFQGNCRRRGVPEKYLHCPEAWEQESEKVMGAGNKTLEMAISQQLLAMRPLFDPEPQRQILRDVTLAITDDAARAESLVPESPIKVTDSIHDAQLAAGVLMQGLPMAIQTGINHIEYVETLLATMGLLVQGIEQSGGVGTIEQIKGLQNMAQHITQHLAIIAQDDNQKQRVKQYADQLSQLMNLVRAQAQRLAEQMEAQQQQNGQEGIDPKVMAQIQGDLMKAQVKAQTTQTAHAQRTAQRQAQWEMEQERQAKAAASQLEVQRQEADIELGKEAAKTAMEVTQMAARKGRPNGSE